jgi:ethanolamine utilization microcompartment shell protein EutL
MLFLQLFGANKKKTFACKRGAAPRCASLGLIAARSRPVRVAARSTATEAGKAASVSLVPGWPEYGRGKRKAENSAGEKTEILSPAVKDEEGSFSSDNSRQHQLAS